jgi:hypothetical protein
VSLEAIEGAGGGAWRCEGAWYTLESRAPPELTRRFAMRLEQMFAAYRQLFPPRVKPRETLRIVIHGALQDYQALAAALGAPLENAAFYHPQRNLVAAGSDLARLAGQLAQVQAQHDALRAELERMRSDLPERLEQRKRQLSNASLSETARRKLLVTYRRQIEQELTALERKMGEFDRQNESVFEQQAGRVLALLHHEAFHAYLENYVYPQADHDVPRWLNEGLAQVFEQGQLEAGMLRVDLPDRKALALLAAELHANPAPLARILTADHRRFLVVHQGDRGNQLNYASAWSLAYYLTFVRPTLSGARLDRYVSKSAANEDPVARFERLVDQPLVEFEAQWRDWVLKRKP